MLNHGKGLNITAFVIGGFLGASAVLAFSPKSRKQISRELKSKSEKYLNRVKKSANDLIKNSKASAESLQRKAEDMMHTIEQFAMGKLNKPVSLIENEIAGLRAAIIAARTSYSLNPDIQESDIAGVTGPLSIEYEDETLPKQLGMGKGRNRKSYSL